MKLTTKLYVLFGVIAIALFGYVEDVSSLLYSIGVTSTGTVVLLLYVISIIAIVILTWIFVKLIKKNIKESKTNKESFLKAGIFTLLSILIIFLINILFESTLGSGILVLWFILGAIILNVAYYLTLIIYKIILKK